MLSTALAPTALGSWELGCLHLLVLFLFCSCFETGSYAIALCGLVLSMRPRLAYTSAPQILVLQACVTTLDLPATLSL